MTENQAKGTLWPVAAALFCRILLNTAKRFAYPFAPVLSRGLGVPLTSIGSLLAVMHASALLGIFTGPLSDQWGYRRMMLAAMALLAAGMLSGGLFPLYGVVMAGLFVANFGKTLFDPAVQAYAGERIPYARRGLAIGILEMSWAGSTLLGVPVAAVLIEGWGWRAPFWVLGICAAVGVAAVARLADAGHSEPGREAAANRIRTAWRELMRRDATRGLILFAFFCSMANDALFVVCGVWLETAFSLSILAIGAGTAFIGAAELFGESATALLSDRLGLKRSLVLGQTLSLFSNLLLPLFGFHLVGAVAGLFVLFFTFEFTFVTALSFCTELLPRFRATMMAFFLAAAGMGRICGALTGPHLWLSGGIRATAAAAVLMHAAGLLALYWGVREGPPARSVVGRALKR